MARSREVGGIAALLVIGVTTVLVLTAVVAVALGKLMVTLASPSGTGADSAASTFMAANAAFSGLALAAVLVTFAVQQRKARHHRHELSMQRRELTRTHAQLYRSAEADVRAVHVELLKIAIENPELIAVWPGFESVPAERGKELLYANLVFAQHLLAFRLDNLRPSEMQGHLRVLVQSAKFRDYWAFTSPHRAVLDPDGDEVQFGRLVDAAITEYERGRSIQPY
ncbi:DUF6082 family protein [Streptomyces sp. NPDC058691]|uniref:DUF6082 family protein n=1 Tax=Streptomyces sp. NPDC058691 TaxID=3346601 RepID=UPI0036561828